jgi:hypothetical protein
MSSKGVVPPSVAKKRGVVPSRSSVVKILPAEWREELTKPAPTLLSPAAQPFDGISAPRMSTEEKKEAADHQANPLLQPSSVSLKK